MMRMMMMSKVDLKSRPSQSSTLRKFQSVNSGAANSPCGLNCHAKNVVSARAQRVTSLARLSHSRENSCGVDKGGGGDLVVEIEGCGKGVVIFVSIFSSSFFSEGKEIENGT